MFPVISMTCFEAILVSCSNIVGLSFQYPQKNIISAKPGAELNKHPPKRQRKSLRHRRRECKNHVWIRGDEAANTHTRTRTRARARVSRWALTKFAFKQKFNVKYARIKFRDIILITASPVF